MSDSYCLHEVLDLQHTGTPCDKENVRNEKARDDNSLVLAEHRFEGTCNHLLIGRGRTVNLLAIEAAGTKQAAVQREVLCEFELKSACTVASWNKSGACVVAGDEDGSLYFLSRRGALLFSQKVLAKGQRFRSIKFVDSGSADDLFDCEQVGDELFIACENPCALMRFSNLGVDLLEDAAEAENKALLKSVRESAKFQSYDLSDVHLEGTLVDMHVSRNILGFLKVVIADNKRMSVWISRNMNAQLEFDCKRNVRATCKGPITMVTPTGTDHQVLLTLSKNENANANEVCVWDARKLFFLCKLQLPEKLAQGLISSIVVLGKHIGFLYKQQSSDHQTLLLGTFGFTGSFQIVYEPGFAKFPNSSSLIHAPGSFFYVLGIDPKNDTKIRGFICCESTMELRFERLVKNGQYDDALKLATEHNLAGKDRVYKQKLFHIVKSEQVDLEQVKSILDSLVDLSPETHLPFIVEGCMKAKFHVKSQQLELLQYAESVCKRFENEVLEKRVQDTIFLLHTFTMIWEFEQNAWQSFRMCILEDKLRELLREGLIAKASILLQRHQPSVDMVTQLECIEQSSPLSVYVAWIQDHVGKHNLSTKAIRKLCEWTTAFAMRVENQFSASQALRVVEQVLHSCGLKIANNLYVSPRQHIESIAPCDSAQVADLLALDRDLREVIYLAKTHKLKLSLDEFRSFGLESVILMLLDRVMAPEMIQSQIETHVIPCCARYGLNEKEMLLNFVERVALDIDSAHTSKEQCAVAVVKGIQKDKTLASKAVLALMRSVVTYSPELEELVKETQKWSMHDQIAEQQRLMNLRKLVSRFHVEKLTFGDVNDVRALLLYVLAHVNGQNREVIQDALEIAKTYQYIDMGDVFSTVLENLVIHARASSNEDKPSECSGGKARDENIAIGDDRSIQQRVDALFEMVKLHKKDVEVFLRARTFCEWTIEEEREDPECISRAALVAKQLCKQMGHADEWIFDSILKFHEQFNIVLCANDLNSEMGREGAYTTHVLDCLESLTLSEAITRARLIHGNDMTKQKMSCDWIYGQMGYSRARKGQFQDALSWSHKLSGGMDAAFWKSKIAVALTGSIMKELHHRRDEQVEIKKLLMESICDVSDGMISSLMDLVRKRNFVDMIMDRCCDQILWEDEEDDETTEQEELRKRKGRNIRLCDDMLFYKEKSNILNGDVVLPLVAQMLISRNRYQDLVKHLSENGALQLALGTLMVSFSNEVSSEEVQHCLVQLVEKVLQAPTIDHELGIGYLVHLSDRKAAFSLFRSSLPKVHKSDFQRLESIALLGVDIGRVLGDHGLTADCERLQLNACWWQWLSKRSVVFDIKRFNDQEYIQSQLLEKVIQVSSYDLLEVMKFSTAYGLGNEMVCCTFIKMFVCNGDLEMIVNPLKQGQLEKARNFVDRHTYAKFRQHLLQQKLNGKDYERLKLVVDDGSRSEDDQGFEQQRSHVLDLLQFFHTNEQIPYDERIDFLKLFDEELVWDTLEQALTMKSIKWLVTLSDPLGIDPDDLYMCLIKKYVAEIKTDDLVYLLDRITNRKLAIRIVHEIIIQAREDEDKITFLQYCLNIDSSNVGFKSELIRIETKLDLKRFLLHSGAWAATRTTAIESTTKRVNDSPENDEEDVNHKLFVLEGKDLMVELYERFGGHAAFLVRENHEVNRLHDLVDRIGTRYGENVEKLRKYLLLKWLNEQNVTEKEEKTLKRKIMYVVKKHERPISFLLNFVFQNKNVSGRTFASRTRALDVLFSMGPEEEIRKVYEDAGGNMKVLMEYWQYCVYMIDFEQMRLPYTIEQLMKCDKVGLIRGLWRDHRENERAILLICNFIIDFKIFDDIKMIEAVIRQMWKLDMTNQVLGKIEAFVANPEIVSKFLENPQAIRNVLQEIVLMGSEDPAILNVLRTIFAKLPIFDPEFLMDHFQNTRLDIPLHCAMNMPFMDQRIETLRVYINKYHVIVPVLEMVHNYDHTLKDVCYKEIKENKLEQHLEGHHFFKNEFIHFSQQQQQ